MRLDNKRQSDVLLTINELFQKRGVDGTAYLFGGNSLIAHKIVKRTTKDLDFFLLIVDAPGDLVNAIKAEALKQFKIKIDIGLNGCFEIAAKGFTWTLPQNAYKRASLQLKLSNFKVYALHPLDIVALKCDRLNKQDQDDITLVLKTLQPVKEEVISVFEEYGKLLSGNQSSIDNIRENFYQLVLTLHGLAVKDQA